MRALWQRLKALWTKEPVPAPVSPQEVTVATPEEAAAAIPATPSPPPRIREHQSAELVLSHEHIYEALRKCYDPEIPVNIVDLGLIYDVQIAEDTVDVKMSLTTRGCGMGGYISGEAAERIRALPGVREVNVEVVWDPPWDPSMISPAGRKVLGLPEETANT